MIFGYFQWIQEYSDGRETLTSDQFTELIKAKIGAGVRKDTVQMRALEILSKDTMVNKMSRTPEQAAALRQMNAAQLVSAYTAVRTAWLSAARES